MWWPARVRRRPDRATHARTAALLLAATATWASAGQPPEVELRRDDAGRRVDVLVGDRPFTAYIYPESLKKPVLFPILTALGAAVTRGYPLEPRPGERLDHPHQVGLWLTYGDVNGVDFWNNSTVRPPELQAQMGTIVHRGIDRVAGGAGQGQLAVRADWVLPGGRVALHETTLFTFRGEEEARFIDRETKLQAAGGRVVLGDNKEGLLGIRVARALESPTKEPVLLTDAAGRAAEAPVLDNTGVTGEYLSSEGKRGDAVWGTRARWVALCGLLDGAPVTLAILDHPENPGHPTYWHARGYGLFAANPLGQRVFSDGRESLLLTLAPGERVTFRFRVVLVPAACDAGKVNALYQAYSSTGR